MFGRRPLFGGPATRGGHRRQRHTWKLHRQLVGMLLSVRELHQQDTRHELLDLMGEHLDLDEPFSVPDNPDARKHLRAVVRAAAQEDATLEALRDALEDIVPDDIDAAWFRLAVTALTATEGPLAARFILGLISEFRSLPRDFGRAATSRYRTERRAAGHPVDGRTLPLVLLHLYDAWAPSPDARRRELVGFLRRLDAEPGRSPRLAHLLARIPGEETKALAPAAAGASACAGGQAGTGRRVIIQIRVEEEDAPSDLPYTQRRYSLRGLHYEGTGNARPEFHCAWDWPGPLTGEELARCGDGFLADWSAHEAVEWGPDKRVEFLLPDSLLGYPAEAWPSGSAGRPLSRSCQVVVRSLRRYKDDSLHQEWGRRWRMLDADRPPGDALKRIGWMSTDGGGAAAQDAKVPPEGFDWPDSAYAPLRLTDLADVQRWLEGHTDLACLGLGSPYDYHDPLIREAVLDALLEDGIPVMVWRRDAGDPAHLVDALRADGPPALLAELPDSVLKARKRERNNPLSVGKQITLLWDDPTCVFRGQDGRMSGTQGAG
ncbi:hypothetical protein ACF1A5_18570 [Streptomyces sp. NPDC014864]|uniref:VMAP-C domain-containing protein n=1 Tax=Streptomyces sp. NPDC014864 TaxID=3364924 RepID=UPI0036FD0F98